MRGRKTKVLIVQPTLPGYRRRFFELVDSLTPIHLICSDTSPEGVEGRTEGVAFSCEIARHRSLPGSLYWQDGVVGAAMRRDFEALVVGGNPRYLSSLIAIVIAKIRGSRVVSWGHAKSSTSKSWTAWVRMRLMYLSDSILVYFAEEIPFLPAPLRERAVGIGNSIDTERVMQISAQVSRQELREFAQANGFAGYPLIIMLGRLTEKARVDLVIRALARLKEDGSNVMLVIVGNGPERESLNAVCRELKVGGNVIWAGEISDERKLAMWMRSACLFVYGGSVGLSLIHAFAYALPAVISSAMEDHNPEALLFEDGAHGAVFDARQSNSLADVLADLLKDAEQLVQMGSTARSMVASRLGIERMSERFVAAIEKAIRNSA